MRKGGDPIAATAEREAAVAAKYFGFRRRKKLANARSGLFLGCSSGQGVSSSIEKKEKRKLNFVLVQVKYSFSSSKDLFSWRVGS